MAEFLFEHLDETVEPLIEFFELVKSLLKVHEYCQLMRHEKITCYINKENFEMFKQEKQFEASQLKMK